VKRAASGCLQKAPNPYGIANEQGCEGGVRQSCKVSPRGRVRQFWAAWVVVRWGTALFSVFINLNHPNPAKVESPNRNWHAGFKFFAGNVARGTQSTKSADQLDVVAFASLSDFATGAGQLGEARHFFANVISSSPHTPVVATLSRHEPALLWRQPPRPPRHCRLPGCIR